MPSLVHPVEFPAPWRNGSLPSNACAPRILDSTHRSSVNSFSVTPLFTEGASWPAIEILGRADGLPQPIGTTNSEWYRGYPDPPPTTFIVLGLTPEQANSIFTACCLAGHNGNSQGVENEETVYHSDIFVCGPTRLPLQELWKEHRNFS